MVATEQTERRGETMILNMGPQHPSTHGVLRLLLELDGETVISVTPDIGYLHTGIEKTGERLKYQQAITLTDRMGYLDNMLDELAYVLAVEKLLGIDVPERVKWVRVLFSELERISSHCVWIGTHALDLGALSMFMYAFRDREMVLDIKELVSGVRMMTSYFRVGGLMADLPADFEPKVREFLRTMPGRIDDYEELLTRNELFVERTKGIGVIPTETAINMGCSGPTIRASGLPYDLRKQTPYSGYDNFDFETVLGQNGDVYDRFLCRVGEMRQSLRIVEQALEGMPDGPWRIDDRKIAYPPKDEIVTSMESLIHHFKLFTEGLKPPAGEVYNAIEGARGEMGYYVVSDGSGKPYRFHMRAPSFYNLQALPLMAHRYLVSDIIAIIGSIDIVLGEVDR
ncbi:MAG TPA: NADH dehydrogenase (quinone) subunit D [Chloroflexota bacterium]|nr:NADH dehydrogenase (quinone) subunit D [Chloroflexota bacterium]